MKFNIFIILSTLFLLLSCDQTTINQSKKLDITFDKKYKNSGCSLIYNDDLKIKKIEDVSKLLEKGQLCPEELTRFYLDKIYSDSRSKNVFTSVLKKSALESAKESKKRAKLGLRKGVLDGIPISVKDLADIEGELTRGGSSLTNKKKAKNNAVFIDELQSQGVIILGKTHMTELAFSGLGLNTITATPANPFNEELVSGGSSSGSAVSVSRN